MMNKELKEIAYQVIEAVLPMIRMEAKGQDVAGTADKSALALLEKTKQLLGREYEALKNPEGDEADAKADARSTLRKALHGDAALQTEVQTMLQEIQASGISATTIRNSKNVVHNSNIQAGGDFRLGDNYSAHNHQYIQTENIARDKFESAGPIHINHYYPNNPEEKTAAERRMPETHERLLSPDQIQALHQLVSAGNSGEAIRQVVELTASNHHQAIYQEALHISDKWEALGRKIRIGSIRNDDAGIERSQIVSSLLELIGKL